MINNNYNDKNGTLALTSDLFCRPFCTLWCIQYHNHAWVHLVWKEKKGGGEGHGGGDQWDRAHKRSKNITPADNVLTLGQSANAEPPSFRSYAGEAIDPPVNLFSCTSTAANPGRKAPPPSHPSTQTHTHTHTPWPLLPFTNMIPPEGSPQTSFLINACGWWDHPVSAN